MIKVKKALCGWIVGSSFLLSGGLQAETIVLKVHHFLGPNSPQQRNMLAPWCAAIAKDSNNRLKCQIYPAMQLGGTPAQLYDQARDGVADVVLTLAGYSANRFPLVEVFELPFMMTSAEATSRALWDYAQAFASAEFAQTKLISLNVHSPGRIFSAKKKIEKLADFQGLKIRAPTRQTNKMLAALGATPVGMPVPQVPEALSKGVIDGAIVPYEVAPSIKLHELVQHVTETDARDKGLYTAVLVVAMNKERYQQLPADLQKVIDANSGATWAARFGAVMQAEDVPSKAAFTAAKVAIHTVPPTELAQWKVAIDQLDDQWVKEITAQGHDGQKLLNAARTLIQKYTTQENR